MDFLTLYQNITFTAFFLFIFFSIVQLNYRQRLQINYFLAGAFLCTGLIFLYYWAFSLGLLKKLPFLLNMEIPLSFLAAPFFFLYYSMITGVKDYKTSSILFHSVPFAISFILILIIDLTDPSLRQAYIYHSRVFPDYSINKAIRIINTICDTFVTLYILTGLYNISVLFRSKKMTREITYIFISLVFFFTAGLLLILSNILNMNILTILGLVFFIILPAYHMIFSFRNSEFAMRVIKEARDLRYGISMAKGRDNSLIEARLVQLMEDEEIFRTVDLTIDSLAKKLMITQRNLSQIINSRFHKNFNSFVNSYRIVKAKELLLSEPEKSVVEIALSCGFNSVSSFYNYFKRETGESPHDFLKSKA